ncbi:MAG: type VI secretion system baseplate subunit TssE [Planctomycetes bacterium]|nr:type VI secretion system baseplate subunit TssE [Planctomycetota bacterium]
MSVNRTLLERIRDPDPSGARSLHVSISGVKDSILQNVQRVLNTCQGNSLLDDRYGLPHLTTIRSTMPGSLAPYEAAIRGTIERNEPRLTAVRVKHAPQQDRGMDLRFEISGIILTDDGKTAIRFETFADDEGRLLVR